MLTWGDDVEVHALRERGWSIAAIARHLDRDPKTIRAYVRGERTPGRRRSAPDPLGPFVPYLAARFATVIVPGTRQVQPSFAPVAKHYGVSVEPCPPRRGNRKGSVESAVRFVCGRWWRTMTATTMATAQGSLDRFCVTVGDARPRPPARLGDAASKRHPTVGELAEAEPLLALPAAPYPATIEVARLVGTDATVAFRGNRYSVPPGLTGTQLTLRHRLGTATV